MTWEGGRGSCLVHFYFIAALLPLPYVTLSCYYYYYMAGWKGSWSVFFLFPFSHINSAVPSLALPYSTYYYCLLCGRGRRGVWFRAFFISAPFLHPTSSYYYLLCEREEREVVRCGRKTNHGCNLLNPFPSIYLSVSYPSSFDFFPSPLTFPPPPLLYLNSLYSPILHYFISSCSLPTPPSPPMPFPPCIKHTHTRM